MRRFARRIFNLFRPNTELELQLTHLLGFKPKYLPYYQLAFTHRSNSGTEMVVQNNERLEYLGDAILGAIVAEYLFKKYPYEAEGFLTEMRSRMVRRESLNSVALRMGLNKMVQFNQADRALGRSHIFGNALEALVGAVYLDQGYARTRQFILKGMVKSYMDMDVLVATDTNYKQQLLSHLQRQGKLVSYESVSEKHEGARKVFVVALLVDGKELARGKGFTKKEAGQDASHKALEALNITAAE